MRGDDTSVKIGAPDWSAPLRLDILDLSNSTIWGLRSGRPMSKRHGRHSTARKREILEAYLNGEALHALGKQHDVCRRLADILRRHLQCNSPAFSARLSELQHVREDQRPGRVQKCRIIFPTTGALSMACSKRNQWRPADATTSEIDLVTNPHMSMIVARRRAIMREGGQLVRW